MHHGGIFSRRNVLGSTDGCGGCGCGSCSGLGATGVTCALTPWMATPFARMLQASLKARGATALKTDGTYGACTQAAFQNVTGELPSKDAIEKFFGGTLTCSSFNLTPPTKSSCADGSDAVIEQPGSAPPVLLPLPGGLMVAPGPKFELKPVQSQAIPGISNTALAIGGIAAVALVAVLVLRKR
jgi:hypothetical protein